MEINGDSVVKDGAVQCATRKDLFRIISFLEKHLPGCCEVHLLVLSTLLTINQAYNVYFLPNQTDNDDYLAIVGIKGEHRSDSDNQMQKVWIIGGWYKSESSLLHVYKKIDKIDWKRDIVLLYNAGHKPHPDILQFYDDRHRIQMPFPLLDRFFIDVPDALHLQIDLPAEVYVKSLEPCHAPLVFESWPYKHLTTLQDVSDEIVQLPSAGIFLKINDELVTWMMCHPPNGMSRLLTLESHRRKGYASLVTKYLTKRMAQSGHFPYINTVAGNSVTRKFFESVGFRYLGAGHVWVTCPTVEITSKVNS